jgi:cytochrome o ubiquinol oxidase subunit 2
VKKKYKPILLIILIIGLVVVAFLYLRTTNIQVLNPKGTIARQERDLIYTALALSLIVVIPVYVLTIGFVWRYRENNHRAKYSPHIVSNKLAETIWWLIPTAIISILAVIAWQSSHTLDPYRPISSSTPPLAIQVVALDWKWLFIYPKQNIASVNFFQFPKNTPLDFEVTADAPMNSFWIPQLGGQIYAMPGMSTELHLIATSYGSFYGSSANISGSGFAGMTFTAKSSSAQAFSAWVKNVKQSKSKLSSKGYNNLSKPSQYNPPTFFSSVENGLYDHIINKYMVPNSGSMTNSAGAYT